MDAQIWIDLLAAREAMGEAGETVALLRVEQIAPFPYDLLADALAKFPNAELVWAQEEPLNAGAWAYVRPRIETVTRHECAAAPRTVRYAGRRPTATPRPRRACASCTLLELDNLLNDALR